MMLSSLRSCHLPLLTVSAFVLTAEPFVDLYCFTDPPNASKSSSFTDVSDLGLTMDDFNAPFPPTNSYRFDEYRYESTNKVDTVDDEGCEWTESLEACSVQLLIPGLRGQPAAANGGLVFYHHRCRCLGGSCGHHFAREY
jgi:hypothetical protein